MCGLSGEVVSQTVRLENLGSTVLFYRWERMPLPPLGGTNPKRTLGQKALLQILPHLSTSIIVSTRFANVLDFSVAKQLIFLVYHVRLILVLMVKLQVHM